MRTTTCAGQVALLCAAGQWSTACWNGEPQRLYQVNLDCDGWERDPYGIVDAIARVDTDGDGTVTHADLTEGESVTVVELSGVPRDRSVLPLPVPPEVSAHVDHHGYATTAGSERRPSMMTSMWLDCAPTAQLSLSFRLDDADAKLDETTAIPLEDMALDALDLDVRNRDWAAEGSMWVRREVDGTVSGYFDGEIEAQLHFALPPNNPFNLRRKRTGEVVRVLAYAFRGLPVAAEQE